MPKDTDFEKALKRLELKRQVLELINNYDIEQVFVEDVFALKNTKTLKDLTKVLGLIEDLCAEYQIPFEIMQNKAWKKLFLQETLPVGSKEQKILIKQRVLYLFPNVKGKQDIYDAIGIGYAGIIKLNS